MRINVEGPSTSTAPSAPAPTSRNPPAAAAVPVAVTASPQPGSLQQEQEEVQTPAVAVRPDTAPIEPLLVAVDPAQPLAAKAPAAETSAAEAEVPAAEAPADASEVPAAEQTAVDKGKQPMDPAQEVEFIKAQVCEAEGGWAAQARWLAEGAAWACLRVPVSSA